jgi:hypothetical protein
MERDLQSLFGPHVYSCTHWPIPRNPPPPPHLGSYTRAVLVSQDRRRHLFVTPLISPHRQATWAGQSCWVACLCFLVLYQLPQNEFSEKPRMESVMFIRFFYKTVSQILSWVFRCIDWLWVVYSRPCSCWPASRSNSWNIHPSIFVIASTVTVHFCAKGH